MDDSYFTSEIDLNYKKIEFSSGYNNDKEKGKGGERTEPKKIPNFVLTTDEPPSRRPAVILSKPRKPEIFHSKVAEIYKTMDKMFNFICVFCKENFLNFQFLSRHIFESHFPITKTSDFRNDSRLNKIMKCGNIFISNVGNFTLTCMFCNESNENFGFILNHIDEVHGKLTSDSQKKQKHTGNKHSIDEPPLKNGENFDQIGYSCNKCDRNFSEFRCLQHHIGREHSEEIKKHMCSTCNKKFSTRFMLDQHTNTHTGAKPFKCSDCDKSFSSSSGLIVHKRLHSGIRAYKCDFCSKDFVQRTHLQIHLRIHTGEKPYSCNFCEKKFADNTTLRIHLRFHNNERPYKCMVQGCGKAFVTSSNLREHENIHSTDRPKCQHCEKTFPNKNGLRSHIKKAHESEGSNQNEILYSKLKFCDMPK